MRYPISKTIKTFIIYGVAVVKIPELEFSINESESSHNWLIEESNFVLCSLKLKKRKNEKKVNNAKKLIFIN